jgi:hypothetical protein
VTRQRHETEQGDRDLSQTSTQRREERSEGEQQYVPRFVEYQIDPVQKRSQRGAELDAERPNPEQQAHGEQPLQDDARPTPNRILGGGRH